MNVRVPKILIYERDFTIPEILSPFQTVYDRS